MYPPIFSVCNADSAVLAALGPKPLRLYPFGEAPQGVATPYAVWQTISGAPENYLGQRPDMDQFTLQVDVYALDVDSARAAAEALRYAIEAVAHVVSYGGESRDPETKNYRYSFTVDWWVSREIPPT